MMLSKKTRYAMVALTRLAREYGKGAILISELAQSEKIPQRFLENILLELKKMGILGSKLGKTGGYFLFKHPKDVNFARTKLPVPSEKYSRISGILLLKNLKGLLLQC